MCEFDFNLSLFFPLLSYRHFSECFLFCWNFKFSSNTLSLCSLSNSFIPKICIEVMLYQMLETVIKEFRSTPPTVPEQVGRDRFWATTWGERGHSCLLNSFYTLGNEPGDPSHTCCLYPSEVVNSKLPQSQEFGVTLPNRLWFTHTLYHLFFAITLWGRYLTFQMRKRKARRGNTKPCAQRPRAGTSHAGPELRTPGRDQGSSSPAWTFCQLRDECRACGLLTETLVPPLAPTSTLPPWVLSFPRQIPEQHPPTQIPGAHSYSNALNSVNH